jgi:hypothetical protein
VVNRGSSPRPAETGTFLRPLLGQGVFVPGVRFEGPIEAARTPRGRKGGEDHLNRTEKEEVISQLHEKMAKAKAAILAEPKGLDVATVTELRRKCREAQVDYRIVKNTLARGAPQGTPGA